MQFRLFLHKTKFSQFPFYVQTNHFMYYFSLCTTPRIVSNVLVHVKKGLKPAEKIENGLVEPKAPTESEVHF